MTNNKDVDFEDTIANGSSLLEMSPIQHHIQDHIQPGGKFLLYPISN